MSNTSKNTAAATEEKATVVTEVPEQKTASPSDAKTHVVTTIGDVLKAVEEKRSEGMTVTLTLDENDELQVQVDDFPDTTKMEKLVIAAKGVFRRNKKLMLTGAALMVTSAVVKVLAARQEFEEEAEMVETEVTVEPGTNA